MKKPVLAIGLILFGLFLFQLGSEHRLDFLRNSRRIPTSCQAALVKIEKKVPGNWKVFCEENNLAVEVNEVNVEPDAKNLRVLLYRQLANHLSYIAKVSTPDILEKVFIVRMRLSHPQLEINAVTEGRYIVKLITLDSPEHVMAHLKSTVQVKETVK